MYEIEADPNVWLLGGAKRVQFEAREGEIKTFPLTLIPLREGYPRWLPSVVIRPVVTKEREKETSRDRAAAATDVTCEMDLISQHSCVQVVPDWKSVTVGVGVFGSEGGGEKAVSEAVLLEAGNREDGLNRIEGEMKGREGVVAQTGLPVEFREVAKTDAGDAGVAGGEGQAQE